MLRHLLTDDDRPSSLDDELEDSGIVAGKLSFNENGASSSIDKLRSWSVLSTSPLQSRLSPRKEAQNVVFEIVSAKANTENKKKYVSYTVLVKRSPGLETQPGVLERRYSDFLALYQTLRRRYPPHLSDFAFPKKAIIGNFGAEVIGERSAAFERLLSVALGTLALKHSPELADFLWRKEVGEALAAAKLGRFEDSSVMLENVYFVQEKVLEDGSPFTFHTLCVLVACLNAVDNVSEAQRYAELALTYVDEHSDSELMVPLLVLSVRLRWAVGVDKRPLEQRLHELQTSGIVTDGQPTLLELVLRGAGPSDLSG